MAKNVNDILLNDRNLQIGNICFQWAHLEYLMMLTIGSLLRIDEDTAKIVSAGRDIQARINLSLALANHLNAPKDAVDAIKELRTKLQKEKILDRRNMAIHGHRVLDSNDARGELVEVHFGKGKHQKISQTNETLATLGKGIASSHKKLHEKMLSSGVFKALNNKPEQIE
ncbi:MAG: hypothetical protein L3J04_04980 [Robiginitomaculum sp.]|nr:hypothetical protein [Robiginitomaculum sp.]